jgi:hypothetical protein
MININDIYCHSLIGARRSALKKLDKILMVGSIRPIKDVLDKPTTGFNKVDEICISKYSDTIPDGYESSFTLYVNTYITLLLEEPANLFRPKLIKTDAVNSELKESGLYSNIYDELRTKDPIDISKIKGISIPVGCLYYDDLNYLLFNSYVCNILNGEEDADFKLSRYAFLRQKDLTYRRKEYIIEGAIASIERILSKNGLDIPLYEYDDSKEPCFKLLRR